MARNYIKLSDVINDFILAIDGNDYAAHASDAVIRNYALTGWIVTGKPAPLDL